MRRRLSSVAAEQRVALERLRRSVSDPAVLAELVETSCLLELSKLASSRIDLATAAQLAVDILFDFFSVDGCSIVLEPSGVPAARASAGNPVESDDTIVATFPVLPAEDGAGVLTVAYRRTRVRNGEFFAAAAEQLADGLGSLLESERLRRQLASANAMRLAATLHEVSVEAHLELLVDALAALPGATGALLAIDHPVFGAPLELSAGVEAETATEYRLELQGGTVLARVHWTDDPGPIEKAMLDEVVEALSASISRSEQSRQLREQLEVDPLTGVGNRRRGARALSAAVGRAERHAESVSVLVLDLDHFKRVNDQFGHAVGDSVLQLFASMLVDEVRPYDTVVRTGGEEFLVICPTIDSVGARALAERLCQATPERCAAALPEGMRQTVSIGIAVYPHAADYPDGLVRKADGALYQAKRAGRDMVVLAGVDEPAGEW